MNIFMYGIINEERLTLLFNLDYLNDYLICCWIGYFQREMKYFIFYVLTILLDLEHEGRVH